jgi:hypothetical protein
VDGDRESLGISRSRRLELQAQRAQNTNPVPSSPKISRVNRVVSKRLLPKARLEIREGIWHLSKSSLVLCSVQLMGRKSPKAPCGVNGFLGSLLEAFAFKDVEGGQCLELGS